MKKILMRASMSPLLNYSPAEVLCANLISSNIGNMLFQTSVCRTLMRDDIQFDTIRTKKKYTPEDIKKINENYEYLILPFANAFRQNFIDELDNVTGLVNKLKIPCIVVGVGTQIPLQKEVNYPDLDEAVKRFMKAVLKKSAMVGLRGEVTADYLTGLGFQAEKDFTVIGCPSLYMYGNELPEMKIKELTPESAVSMNSKISLSKKFHNFMWRSSQALPNHNYIPQVVEEIRRMYVGTPFPKRFLNKEVPEHFPTDYNSPIYSSGNAVSFTNVPSWLNYLKQRDFSFGSRVHGNIAAILAGIPCFILVSDKRIMELVDYHNIPHLPMQELTAETDIFTLYDKADFSALRKGHQERFAHYMDFLHDNGLQTIFDDANMQKNAPYDICIKNTVFTPEIKAFSTLTPEQQLERLEAVHRQNVKKEKFYREFYRLDTMSPRDKWANRKKKEMQEEGNNYFPLIREYDKEAKRLNKI